MSGSIGSTPGNYHRRSANLGHTSGALHKRFGKSGLIRSKNMTGMNRAAVDNVRAAFANSGPQIFDAKSVETYGQSELVAQQVLQRAKDAMNKLAEQGESTKASVNLTV